MKVVITGAKGFLGSHVTRTALAADHEVIGVDLPEARSDLLIDAPGKYIDAAFDILNPPEPLPETIRGADAFIHCAGLITGKPGDIHRVNVEGTRTLVNALEDQEGLRFVFLSSMAIFESHSGAYGRSKKEAEDLVMEKMTSHAVIRPSMIYGPSDPGWTARLRERVTKRRLLFLPGGGKFMIQPVYVEDVAQAILQACVEENARGCAFELGGPASIEQVEFLRRVRERLKGKTRFIAVPLRLFRTAGVFLGGRIQAAAAFAGTDHLVDIEPARQILGFDPRPPNEGLALTFP
ncbi:MAG: NAD-dependent epimerase/dehydratase family protein [Planctomycetota bacterium]|jgi:nucleoside-diphosphate-sugar epimerase